MARTLGTEFALEELRGKRGLPRVVLRGSATLVSMPIIANARDRCVPSPPRRCHDSFLRCSPAWRRGLEDAAQARDVALDRDDAKAVQAGHEVDLVAGPDTHRVAHGWAG
ncbi:MAG: hypothetical protein U1F49_05330 [Rubrivivax sp.]